MITFFSNFINEHQIPFCNAMYQKTNGQFRFVATESISAERLSMGFKDQSNDFPYVIKAYESDVSYLEAMELGEKSDVVIIGDAPDEFVQERIEAGKLTFRYWERFFKQGRWRILDPRVLKARYQHDIRYRNRNLHMLCASAYTAPDCRFIFSYPNKTYRWGYFPEVKRYEDVEKVIGLKHPASILWVGRLIGLKHPDASIRLAEKLKQEGYQFKLDIIGEGDKKPYLIELIKKKNLENCVQIHGFMPPEQVREWMERADIYLFTSDHNEGWGAVLNESMNAACAVVACREIGSVPYLIEDGANGFQYDRKKKDDLFMQVKQLLDDDELKHSMQRRAYETMLNTWNADAAADRLLHLIDCLQEGKEVEYTTGPCSRD